MKQVFETTNKLAVSVLLALSLGACQKQDASKLKGDVQIKVSAADKMSSDELTSAAEQLISPYTFMVSHQMAKKALEKNPGNVKAEFIMLLTKRFEAFRGLHTRIRPMMKGVQVKRHEDWIQRFPNSPLKSFLTAPGTPIRNVNEAQGVIADYFESINEFRQFLKKNQTTAIEIQLNPQVFEGQIREEMADRCRYIGPEQNLELVCDFASIATKKLNTADFVALRQILAGEMLYSILNNYSLQGIEKLEDQKTLTSQQRLALLDQTQSFGVLSRRHTFGVLRDIGADLSGAVKWAIQYKQQLCPKGTTAPHQRRGYLFGSGICVDNDDATQKLIAIFDNAVRGATRIEMKAESRQVVTTVDAFAWSTKPMENLRSAFPSQWNECGKATSLRDNTLGGMFPENNAHILLEKKCN